MYQAYLSSLSVMIHAGLTILGWEYCVPDMKKFNWANSQSINLSMKNLIWVAFCKVLTKAIKFKDTGQWLASLLKEYCVVLQVTNITHNPPTPNLFENTFHQEFSKYNN